jgi:Holliday junction resolvase-like predicted endonuclease
MGNLDRDHPQVRRALIAAGWQIVKERLALRWGAFSGEVDLLARSGNAADPDTRIIVVEVKSFRPRLRMSDVEKAIGQYLIYKSWLARQQPTWSLYLAVSTHNARFFRQEPLRVVVQDYGIQIVAVDLEHERIASWE